MKQHFEDNSKGQFLLSDPVLCEWWRDKMYKTKEAAMQSYLLLNDNRAIFKELWGKQDFCVSDSARRRLYVWNKKLSNGELWFITAKERGTSIEWSSNNEKFRDDVKEYLANLISEIEQRS